MTIKPLSDRVVLKKEKIEEKSKGGILLSAGAKEKPIISTVVAIGPGTKDCPITVKVGDRVITETYGGKEVTLDDETFTIIKQSEILAIIE